MKRTSFSLLLSLALLFFCTGGAESQTPPQTAPTGTAGVIHIETALDHITVLEFAEPVLQAAAGSSAFNIEFRDNKVLIKPLKPRVSTDLFVWTGSRRFAYELDPPGEVKNMTVALDNRPPKPVPTNDEAMTQVADIALTHALLGSEKVDSRRIKDQNGRVVVRIEAVFESRNSTYIRYSVKNLGVRPYRVITPTVRQLWAPESTISLLSLERTQLDDSTTKKLRVNQRVPLVVATAQTKSENLAPNDETHGVVVLRHRFPATAVIEVAFPNSGDRHVSAIFVY